MNLSVSQIARARIPLAALPQLARLRCHPGIRVTFHEDHAWLQWPTGDDLAVAQLVPIAGVQFFAGHQGKWYANGSRLPAHDLPATEPSLPLDQILLPPSDERQPPVSLPIEPIPVRLVADDLPRPTSALVCSLQVLVEWADRAPSEQIEQLMGAISESRVLLTGANLPLLAGNQRFWGDRVLVPLGARCEPHVSEVDLLEAWGAGPEELVLFDGTRPEIVPSQAFIPLSRSCIRRAARGEVK
jgi:MoxR-vWA-beta-propeller ternary system domain bpX2